MKNFLLFVMILTLAVACKNEVEPVDEKDYEGYTLEWAEEFNTSISEQKWVYETGDGTDYGLAAGWGNSEKQLYTSSSNNSLIQGDDGNSVLAIVAKKEAGEHQYSSAKLTTQGLKGFRFGRVEARIKVPQGKGLWPAFWLLGDNITDVDWPGCGEIDIMEVIGHEPNLVHSSVHYTNADNKVSSNTAAFDNGQNLADDYHVYRLDWTPNSMKFMIDETIVQETLIEADMKEFLRSFYIILNVAVGGNWPGLPDETTVFPQKMFVDWVRVYSMDGLEIPEAPALDVAEETLGTVSGDLAKYAFNEEMAQFEDILVKTYGAGGEPDLASSDIVVEGDSSLLLSYPGSGWGGAFFILEPVIDGQYLSGSNLKFSIKAPAEMTDIEIKLESLSTAHSLFLANYSGLDAGNGFLEYTIPISDFTDLELTDLKIPFALWNPVYADGSYFVGDILLDNVYFE